MALPTSMFSRHFDKVRTDLPTTITVAATNYTAVVGDESRGQLLGDAGLFGDDAIPCVIKKADFTTVPDNGTKVTVGGRVYRVQTFVDDPAGICRTLNLVEDD